MKTVWQTLPWHRKTVVSIGACLEGLQKNIHAIFHKGKKYSIDLSDDEALVLLEFAFRFRDDGKLSIDDPAEKVILWRK